MTQTTETRRDRWTAAVHHFEEAGKNYPRGTFTQAASDWAAFGYLTHTLDEYFAVQVKITAKPY